MIGRRAFLIGLLAAPAIVQASSLMKVRGIIMPVREKLVGDLTIYVDHYKPNAFRTIQAAMDYIEKFYPLGGEAITVQIGPGTYEGPIKADLHNNLIVKGHHEGGNDYTTNIVAPPSHPLPETP